MSKIIVDLENNTIVKKNCSNCGQPDKYGRCKYLANVLGVKLNDITVFDNGYCEEWIKSIVKRGA